MPDHTDSSSGAADPLDALFRRQFAKSWKAGKDILTAPGDQLEAALNLIVGAIVRAQLPELSADDIALMVGQLTPNHRELLLACIQLLEKNKDVVAALGFGPEVFGDILGMDVSLENLGGALDRLGRLFATAETLQGRTQSALNAKVLLAVDEVRGDPNTPRLQRDQLGDDFGAAFNRQAEIFRKTAPAAATGGDALPGTLAGLKAQLKAAEQDGAVMRNLNSIVGAARLLEGQGKGLLPAHKKKGPAKKKTAGGNPGGVP